MCFRVFLQDGVRFSCRLCFSEFSLFSWAAAVSRGRCAFGLETLSLPCVGFALQVDHVLRVPSCPTVRTWVETPLGVAYDHASLALLAAGVRLLLHHRPWCAHFNNSRHRSSFCASPGHSSFCSCGRLFGASSSPDLMCPLISLVPPSLLAHGAHVIAEAYVRDHPFTDPVMLGHQHGSSLGCSGFVSNWQDYA